jgi:hypothetical protein
MVGVGRYEMPAAYLEGVEDRVFRAAYGYAILNWTKVLVIPATV